jgi:hypothetical protein
MSCDASPGGITQRSARFFQNIFTFLNLGQLSELERGCVMFALGGLVCFIAVYVDYKYMYMYKQKRLHARQQAKAERRAERQPRRRRISTVLTE